LKRGSSVRFLIWIFKTDAVADKSWIDYRVISTDTHPPATPSEAIQDLSKTLKQLGLHHQTLWNAATTRLQEQAKNRGISVVSNS
jgi:hypothetical protein